MTPKLLILVFCLIPFLSHAQHDVLILQKRGAHVHAYAIGDPFVFKTVYGQWFSGTIEDLHHDSIYINGLAFHYKEIGAIRNFKGGSGGHLGAEAMIAGVGFLAIGAVNGALRHDPAGQWYTTSGWLIGGTLIAGGFLLTQLKGKNYNLGGRFKLQYLQIGRN
jgi:hypothetical protein